MAHDPETTAPPPGEEQDHQAQARSHRRWWLAGAIIVVSWCCLRFPQNPITPALDPSWMAVLVYAHGHGMQFGRDIACTYGPLGFLSIECFTPQVAAARLFFELVAAIGMGAGLCLAAWRLALPWRLAALGFFIFFSSTERWGGSALYLDLGIFLWGWLCFLEQERKCRIFATVFVLLAATAALVKFTFLLLALFTVGLLACNFALQRRLAIAAGLAGGFAVAFTAGWLLSGQSLSNLPAYFTTSLEVASGYNQSMGSTSVDPGWLLLMTLSGLAAITIRVLGIPVMNKTEAWHRGILVPWFAGLLFAEWKYGCVRSDWAHAALAAGVMPILAVCAQATPGARKAMAFAGGAAVLICMATPLLFMQSQIEGPFLTGHLKQTFQNMAGSFKVLSQPTSYLREEEDLYSSEKKREQLPWIRATVGNSTVDVFGRSQAIAVLNDLNYRPRPVFQSYAAYSAGTMKLNELFYESENAPEYVILKLEPLDERFPPLEDASALRELLANYELAGYEANYSLLGKKRITKPQMTLLKEGKIRAGEKLDLSAFQDTGLSLEIEFHPTLYGRLRTFFYKPPETTLNVWTESSPASPAKFQAPAAMLSAGFLASPLILRDQDASNFLARAKGDFLEALSVEPTVPTAWQEEIDFRIYRKMWQWRKEMNAMEKGANKN